MLALIDGDIVTYRVGFTTENDPVEIACARVNETIEKILRDTNANSYRVYLTGEDDPEAFRKHVYPEYKAHRKAPKPKWYRDIRDYIWIEWNASTTNVIEADDALAIDQFKETFWAFGEEPTIENLFKSIICSIDKDLKQIPGHHYNFVKEERSVVSPEDGLKYFYTQLLTGDSADNIKGVWKVGPQKAAKILQDCTNEQQMFDAVRSAYSNDEEMLMNGRVLWIWRTEGDDWIHHWERLSDSAVSSENAGR